MPHTPVGVFVPASTANLGPGFDCLGIALDFGLWARAVPARRTTVQVSGEGTARLPRDERNLVHRALRRAMQEADVVPVPVSLEVRTEIPLARGLGSSSAAIVAGIVLGDALCGHRLSRDQMLHLAWQIEGHPDNVAPALLGGCVVVVADGDRLYHATVSVPEELRAVLFIPDFEMSTAKARAVMPDAYSRADCVFNVSRAALLVASFATGDLSLLHVATQDRIHQPSRGQVFPALPDIIDAAIRAGAAGAFLSGAGSTVCALTSGDTSRVAAGMTAAATAKGFNGAIRVARPSPTGAHVQAAHAVGQAWE